MSYKFTRVEIGNLKNQYRRSYKNCVTDWVLPYSSGEGG